ncbi:6-phosphofructokinase 1 [Hypnocyclicus thermotrophus]|uniref:ATP-dependent 6-phosphofructokinase n=1 Tax=Hypnocyclicus thermotrophus TaxID=1627895 RepID=A0AA46DZX3_9FUSO|nr:ATP-dependent 6-phosphofructokinase [Hypnocyclicus thermotrophus]TDT72004.1 6-phosphofructokinase 1 [Hypnocyclicus thermotrophus]
MESVTKRFGVLTAGGDCPGLNAAMRGLAKTAMGKYNMEIVGFYEGYRGLVNNNAKLMTETDFSGILHKGGSILGSSRERPFKDPEKVKKMVETYKKWELDCLVVLGGNGTQKRGYWLSKEGCNVIGLPKTIDNDIYGNDISFGFHSALEFCTDALDRLHTTASSHKRVLIAEIMGNSAGWLALYAGLAGGADVIIIPEIPYDIKKIKKHVEKRMSSKNPFCVIAVAEGAVSIDEANLTKKELKKKRKKSGLSAGYRVSKELNAISDFESRVSVLGYLQRGGTPTGYDRVISTQFGVKGAELLAKGKYNKMVAAKGLNVVSIPLEEVAEKVQIVPVDNIAIKSAKATGISFGD